MFRVFPRLLTAAGAALALVSAALATPTPAEQAFQSGDYEKAAALTRDSRETDPRAMEIQLRALLATGHYKDAADLAAENTRRFPADAPALLATHDALQAAGRTSAASDALMVASRTQQGNYDPASETPAAAAARARSLMLLGADPKLVLDRILDEAIKLSPDAREPRLALADIALEKHDYALAAKTLRDAAQHFPDDADIQFALARAFQDPKQSSAHLGQALKANPRLVPALLFNAQQQIDQGDFKSAGISIDAALAVNPASPEAWARKSLLASLANDDKAAAAARAKALEPWPKNPEVDYLIGSGLARRYRFEEGIAALRSALEMDPSHMPSHFELGSDLLRYKGEEEGWTHIERVAARDPYNVAAFNLLTLRDAMKKMETLSGPGVELRLANADRIAFGPQALALCVKARRDFSAKYGVEMPFDVTVDMLPTEQDFAVRTFDLPGSEGFLGVCFGPLVTTCSPHGRLERANWQSVLWHEMAHTVTLTGTRHRIPRWLSEGISVHEENLAGPGWGMGMNSKFRDAILTGKSDDKKLPPVLELDSEFSGDTQLAYFRSAMVVAYLDQRVGTTGIRRILNALGKNQPIEKAFESVVSPMDKFETDFETYARAQAEAYGPKINWEPLSDDEFQSLRKDPAAFLAAQPNRYFAIMDRAHALARQQDWNGVKSLLEPAIALVPNNREEDNPYLLLAAAYRGLDESEPERAALEKLLSLDASSLPAARALLENAQKKHDSDAVARAAESVLAIDPFNSDALLALGRSRMKSGSTADALAAYEALLAGKPLDAPRLRLELATALYEHHDPAARRQVLLALEENPRLLPALDLLRRMHDNSAPLQ